MRAWPALILLCLLPARSQAAQLPGVQVTRDGARFLIRMHIAVDAPAAAVFRALRDYAALPRYEPAVRAVRVEPTAQAGRVRLYTTVHTCVLWFCKTVHQQQIITATASAHGGVLESELLGRGGDFAGHGLWQVAPCRDAPTPACLDVRLELVPTFWVPPVIGPWLVRRKMAQAARRTSAGLEQLARSADATG